MNDSVNKTQSSQPFPDRGDQKQFGESLPLGTWWYVPPNPTLETYRRIEARSWEGNSGVTASDLMFYPRRDLFTSEKDAISAARKYRIAEIDRLQAEVNALDERYDALEDEEMRQEAFDRR